MEFAVINVNLIFEQSDRGRELTQKLQAASKSWQTKWQGVEEARQRIMTQLKAADGRRPQGGENNLQRELQGLDMELSYLRQRGDAELKAQVQTSQDAILSELAPILATYAKEQGLTAVFTLPATPALYVDPAVDITKEVIAYYNAHLKGATPGGPAGPTGGSAGGPNKPRPSGIPRRSVGL